MRLLTAYRIVATLGMFMFFMAGLHHLSTLFTGEEPLKGMHEGMTIGAVLWAVFAVLAHRRAEKLGVSSE